MNLTIANSLFPLKKARESKQGVALYLAKSTQLKAEQPNSPNVMIYEILTSLDLEEEQPLASLSTIEL